jgi:hypothetical protein
VIKIEIFLTNEDWAIGSSFFILFLVNSCHQISFIFKERRRYRQNIEDINPFKRCQREEICTRNQKNGINVIAQTNIFSTSLTEKMWQKESRAATHRYGTAANPIL